MTSLVTAMTAMEDSNDTAGDNNTTINVGYFMQDAQRVAAIGMAIDQIQSEGRLTHYDFQWVKTLWPMTFIMLIRSFQRSQLRSVNINHFINEVSVKVFDSWSEGDTTTYSISEFFVLSSLH